MPMPRKIALCAAMLGLVACAHPNPPAPPAPVPTMAVNASFGRTWDAAIDVFAAQNVPIQTLDRSSGLIVAQPLSIAMSDQSISTAWADCGDNGQHVRFVPSMAYYNVLVRGDSTHATVHVTAKWVSVGGGRTVSCSTKGVFEINFETLVKQKAEAHATSTGPTAH